MDNSEVGKWLDVEWSKVLEKPDTSSNPAIDRLVNSEVQSIRYAVMTQILGKIADPKRGLLHLQQGYGEDGAWDARSFCTAVIVPWVTKNHNVLGKSTDPYVSNPLRKAKLSHDMPQTKNQEDWESLVSFLESIENASPNTLRKVYRQCLFSVAQRLRNQTFQYPIPLRISATRTRDILESFLSEQSGGFRPMVVATALMRVLGKGFNLFTHVESQGTNEPDAASGMPGDIICYSESGDIVMAIEVKDRGLTFTDVKTTIRKIQTSDKKLSHLIFMASDIQQSSRDQIRDSVEQAWVSGLNLYHIDLFDLLASGFALLGEKWHPHLLTEIGSELDQRGEHHHRQAWFKILSNTTKKAAQL